MQTKFCQSCGMPMGKTDELYGHNSDGSKNQDYCSYCYDNGKFSYDCTMGEMINICTPHMLKNNPTMSEEQAKQLMTQFFPTLKRWQ